ncbi:hypothetical protein [Methylobacterium sp. J-070]|uniref:hypothetical protein n=1 Tax=Methylobacterium sp. J-070 TaxID=2836650 RepID=UPI001FBBB1FC|nr:hypothetical protein [Methylobacterium sp. J-070]MCJ2050874.1 hypothetical protein [Methylobacterium sp. J-070]
MSPESHGLPGVLGEIAEVAGLAAALAVAEAVGGTRAYVPRRPGPDHWLVRAAGPEAAAAIADHLTTGRSGSEIEFPIGPAGSYVKERRRRARKMRELTAQGLPNRQTARQVGVTERAVRLFKARVRRDDSQGDLGL